MPIGLSCYIFCFNLTVLNLDWSLELPLLDSAWIYRSVLINVTKILLKTSGGWHRNLWRHHECLDALSDLKILFEEKFSIALELKGKHNGVWSVEQEICSCERKFR